LSEFINSFFLPFLFVIQQKVFENVAISFCLSRGKGVFNNIFGNKGRNFKKVFIRNVFWRNLVKQDDFGCETYL